MHGTTLKNFLGIVAAVALSACAGHAADERQPLGIDNCPPPNTLTCDRFAGENYNCTCERGDRLKDILDSI